MKYLSGGIHAIDGAILHSKWSLLDVPDLCVVQLAETGVDGSLPMKLTDVGEDVYGVGIGKFHECGSVVIHDKKTISLYKHIFHAGTELKIPPPWMEDVDCFVFSNNGLTGWCDSLGQDLFINTEGKVIDLAGPQGSCAVWITNNKSEIFNLYEFLGFIYQTSGVNIFKFRDLVFFSNRMKYVTTIRLDQSAEGARYFTKMRLDVMKA